MTRWRDIPFQNILLTSGKTPSSDWLYKRQNTLFSNGTESATNGWGRGIGVARTFRYGVKVFFCQIRDENIPFQARYRCRVQFLLTCLWEDRWKFLLTFLRALVYENFCWPFFLGRSSREPPRPSKMPTGVKGRLRRQGGHVLISSLNRLLWRMAIRAPFNKMRRTLFYHMGYIRHYYFAHLTGKLRITLRIKLYKWSWHQRCQFV